MTRSTTPATPRSRTAIPHSSRTSRRAASAVVSPRSTRPPGMLHLPAAGLRPRRTRRTRSPSSTTAPTPTRGWSGYSREVGNEPAALIPFCGPVLFAHEPVDELLLLARESPRPELDPVRAGEALGYRGRRFGEARAPAQYLLERRHAREGIAVAREEDPHALGVDPEHQGPTLQEPARPAPRGAADRDGGRHPAEEAHGRGTLARQPPTPEGLVHGHVRHAVEGFGQEQPPGPGRRRGPAAHPGAALPAGRHRRFGWRAASVWSRRRTEVVTGASRMSSGLFSASPAIWIIASQKASSVSFDSVSVGSIMSASSTIRGK